MEKVFSAYSASRAKRAVKINYMQNKRIAYFISPHGYGHAARAAAVMEAIYRLNPDICFDIFTSIPEIFIRDSVSVKFQYHSVLTDIGLVQSSPLHADINETVKQLDLFFPIKPDLINMLEGILKNQGSELVICDIAPAGIAAAKRAGIPSVLIENFTWDWLYQGYTGSNSNMERHIDYLKHLFSQADHHIQARPACCPGSPELTTYPISRKPRTSARATRKKFNIEEQEKLVIISMGGVPDQYPFLQELCTYEDYRFIIPCSVEELKIQDNLILLPRQSGYFHPDLINACDAVIGKTGYSTLAEIYHAGVPFGYIAREDFRESEVLVTFIKEYMKGLPIRENDFYNGEWVSILPGLIALPRIRREEQDGASQVAEFICRQ